MSKSLVSARSKHDFGSRPGSVQLKETHVGSQNNNVGSALPVPCVNPSKDGIEVHGQRTWEASTDVLEEAYNSLALARERADIKALEQSLAKIYRIKGLEDEILTDPAPRKNIELKHKFSSPSNETQNNKIRPPANFDNNQVVLTDLVKPSTMVRTDSAPSQYSHIEVSSVSPKATHKPVVLTRSNSLPKLSRQAIPKFQFKTTVHPQAPGEKLFNSANEFIQAIEKVAKEYGYLIEQEWIKILPCSFAKVDRYWFENTLLKLKSWSDAKNAIKDHPESRIAKRQYSIEICHMKMKEDESVIQFHEAFINCMHNADYPDNYSTACIFYASLTNRLARLVFKQVEKDNKENEEITVNYIAGIARDIESSQHWLQQSIDLPPSNKRTQSLDDERPAKRLRYFCTQHGNNTTHNSEQCISLNKRKEKIREKEVANPIVLKTPILINGVKMLARCSPELIGDSYMTLKTVIKYSIPMTPGTQNVIRFGKRVVGKTEVPVNYINGISFTQTFDVIDFGGFSDCDLVLDPNVLAKLNICLQGILLKPDNTSYERKDMKDFHISMFRSDAPMRNENKN